MSKCTNLRPCHTVKLWIRHFLWHSLLKNDWIERDGAISCIGFSLRTLTFASCINPLRNSWSLFWLEGKMPGWGGKVPSMSLTNGLEENKRPLSPPGGERADSSACTPLSPVKAFSALSFSWLQTFTSSEDSVSSCKSNSNSYCCWSLSVPPKP